MIPTAAAVVSSVSFIAIQQQQGIVRINHNKSAAVIKRYDKHYTGLRKHHRNHILCSAAENTLPEDDDGSNNNDNEDDSTTKKSLSPLAMAVADWLEEEEDELSKYYWDRYDVAKTSSDQRPQPQPTSPPTNNDNTLLDNTTGERRTTEEILDKYYESRNIDRGMERKYKKEIEAAIEKSSKKASSADEAIQALTPIQQYLQYNTKLGGRAYLELAQAYDANDQIDEATKIYERLASSPHDDIRKRSRELLSMPPSSRPRRTYNRNVWNLFWGNM
jgi:hypothetical protein